MWYSQVQWSTLNNKKVQMNKKIRESFLGIGPMSLNVIDAIDQYSLENKEPIMIICSRNQIEAKELGSGYVNNLSTEEFTKIIHVKKQKNPWIFLCRDHSGPFVRNKPKDTMNEEIEDTKKSLKVDIDCNFDLLHIDTSLCKEKKHEIATELFNFCNNQNITNKPLYYEYGSEEHGVALNRNQFEIDLKFISNFKNIEFIVGTTGSLTKEIYQAGEFNFEDAIFMSNLSKKYNIRIKDHNCDYLDYIDVQMRRKAGLGALNVAPSFGAFETKTVISNALSLSLFKNVNNFKSIVLDSKKWEKWCFDTSTNDAKFFSTGHYFFTHESYLELIYEIQKNIDINKMIVHNHKQFIKTYLDKNRLN